MDNQKKVLEALVLPCQSAVARLGAGAGARAVAAPADAAAAPADALEKALKVLGPRALLEFEPPALPNHDAVKRGDAGVVAAAAGELPPVPVTYDTARRSWVLVSEYDYEYEGHRIIVPAGYSFDLASVPRPLWWLIAPNELSIVAPLFHDYLYEYKGNPPAGSIKPARTYTRREVDDLFLHLMEREGVAPWRRYAAYSAVRAAGYLYWAT